VDLWNPIRLTTHAVTRLNVVQHEPKNSDYNLPVYHVICCLATSVKSAKDGCRIRSGFVYSTVYFIETIVKKCIFTRKKHTTGPI